MEFIEKGNGKLFTNPDPDGARAFFRTKSRSMTNKKIPLKQAIETYVNDGDYIGIGGFGANRTPIAACHEIVRQRKKNLGFAGHTATHDMQILSAGAVFDRIDIAYVVGLEARGLSKCSRRYLESGKVAVTEWTNYALSIRLKAAAMGVSFLPARNMLGTDTFRKSAGVKTTCPFTGKQTVLLPALYPDVSVIHVHEADVYGNARIKGILVSDIELANASKKLIITCERIISSDVIRNEPGLTRIPYYLVDAVCEVPYGGYPGTMPHVYFSDEAHLREWLGAEKDMTTFNAFLKKNIYDCNNHEEYIMLNGGLAKMTELRSQELLLNKEVSHARH